MRDTNLPSPLTQNDYVVKCPFEAADQIQKIFVELCLMLSHYLPKPLLVKQRGKQKQRKANIYKIAEEYIKEANKNLLHKNNVLFQEGGVVMGSSLTPVLSNFIRKEIENKYLALHC